MTDATASFPFPVLGPGRLDYAPECSYRTDDDWTVKDGNTILMRHRIKGDCLVSRLVAEGKAQFACIVVVKGTMYRRTFVHDERGVLFAEQTFTIEHGRRTIETPQMLPIVALTSGGESINAAQADGLDPLWQGQKITLPEGAILAIDRWHEFIPGIGQLLKVVPDKDGILLPHEQMRVDIVDSDGGYFQVRMPLDLYEGIKSAQVQGMKMHLNSILTHALNIGFAKCAAEDEESDIATLPNFQSIKRRLHAFGIPAWDSDGFDPCRAACAIKPHKIGVAQPSEDEDD